MMKTPDRRSSTMSSGMERSNTTAKVVVATTVALSFISFWRAAAIVLSDLASSMFYVGGIAEQAIGKSAPWFILGVMLFSFAVRSSTWKPAACSCAAACTWWCATPWVPSWRSFRSPR